LLLQLLPHLAIHKKNMKQGAFFSALSVQYVVGAVRPGSTQALLASPRWESRLLHFLELSGVGRVMENGEDEEEKDG
jgi:hypothetical protein